MFVYYHYVGIFHWYFTK